MRKDHDKYRRRTDRQKITGDRRQDRVGARGGAEMLENNVGAVVILDNGRLEGIFTERDALKFFVATRRNADVTNVCDTMTKSPITVEPATELGTARDIMVDGKFRHLPVVQAGSVVGVIRCANWSICRGDGRTQFGEHLDTPLKPPLD